MIQILLRRIRATDLGWAFSVLLGIGVFAGQPAPSFAADDDHHDEEGEHRDMDAHVHGMAHLNFAVDGQQLVAEFDVPAMSIVGFEHAAASEAEEEAVKSAVNALKDHAALFKFSGAACVGTGASVGVEGPLLSEAGQDHDGDDEHDADHDDHADADDDHEADHDDHADADDDHEADHDDHADHETHAEFKAVYNFQCDDVENLSAIDVGFFDVWSAIEEIEVIYLAQDRQLAFELTHDAHLIDLK